MTTRGRAWSARGFVDVRTAIEQAIARGEDRATIMAGLGVSYERVKIVHDRMNACAGVNDKGT